MFLPRYERRSGGRKRTYWALAESIRTKRGSRQRIVAYLGQLAASEQSGWAQLGRSLSGWYRGRNLGALHSVSVWASEFGLTLAQMATAEKANEITAIPTLLSLSTRT